MGDEVSLRFFENNILSDKSEYKKVGVLPIRIVLSDKSEYKKVGVLPIRIVHSLTFRALALR